MSASFTRVFLLMLSGPLIWAGHFLFIYIFNGIFCARPTLRAEWMGLSISAWMISAATLLCLAAIGAIQLRMRTNLPSAGDPRFVPVVSCMLALLSVLAIAWETLPVFLVPPCA
ncbi:hypothetical protein GCM10027343_36130 [Noviherbaspirillum agri]